MAKCVLPRMAQNKYFAGLILRLKPGFDDMFSSCGKKNMWKCTYVVLCSNNMVKAHIWFQNFPSFIL